MITDTEMTYIDHLKGQSKIIYKKLNDLLRHTNLHYQDIDGIYGLFTETFYKREDISELKKESIKELSNELQKMIKDNATIDPNSFLERD